MAHTRCPPPGGVNVTILIAHIADIIMSFPRTWTGSDSGKWFLLSKNAKKKVSHNVNVSFEIFYYFSFS